MNICTIGQQHMEIPRFYHFINAMEEITYWIILFNSTGCNCCIFIYSDTKRRVCVFPVIVIATIRPRWIFINPNFLFAIDGGT